MFTYHYSEIDRYYRTMEFEEEKLTGDSGDIFRKLKTSEFKNRVKCSIGLVETKEALEYAVRSRFQYFYKSKVNDIYLCCKNQASRCQDDEHMCKVTAQFINERRQWKLKKHCKRCQVVMDTLSKICIDPSSPKIGWGNSNVIGLPLELEEWEIAKVFMPKGYRKNKGPLDTDAAAIFNIINTCTLFGGKDHSVLDELIKARNTVMHSSNNEIKETEMESFSNNMISLLQSDNSCDIDGKRQPSFKDRFECKDTAGKLENFKSAKIEITIKMVSKALSNKNKAISQDIQIGNEEGSDTSELEKLYRQTVSLQDEIDPRKVNQENKYLKSKNKTLKRKKQLFENFTKEQKADGALLKKEIELQKMKWELLADCVNQEKQSLVLPKDEQPCSRFRKTRRP